MVAEELEHKLESHERNKPQGKAIRGGELNHKDSTAHLHNARVFSKAHDQQGLSSHPHASQLTAITQIPIFLLLGLNAIPEIADLPRGLQPKQCNLLHYFSPTSWSLYRAQHGPPPGPQLLPHPDQLLTLKQGSGLRPTLLRLMKNASHRGKLHVGFQPQTWAWNSQP